MFTDLTHFKSGLATYIINIYINIYNKYINKYIGTYIR